MVAKNFRQIFFTLFVLSLFFPAGKAAALSAEKSCQQTAAQTYRPVFFKDLGIRFKYPESGWQKLNITKAKTPRIFASCQLKEYGDFFWYGFDSWTLARVISDLASYNDPESTGDNTPVIDQKKWNWERKTIEDSKKDSIIPCFNPSGLSKDKVCSIRTLGSNRFIVTIAPDNYKGTVSQVEYRTYIKNNRIVFYGDAFYTEDVLPDGADIKQTPIYQLFLSGKTTFSAEGKMMEEIIRSLEQINK